LVTFEVIGRNDKKHVVNGIFLLTQAGSYSDVFRTNYRKPEMWFLQEYAAKFAVPYTLS